MGAECGIKLGSCVGIGGPGCTAVGFDALLKVGFGAFGLDGATAKQIQINVY